MVVIERKITNYKFVPPDGGWGYIVAISLVNVFTVTIGLYSAFGLVFGEFLRNEGDEISATLLIQSIFTTIFCFMGLLTNSLLTNFSIRTIGLCGAMLYVTGAFLTIFTRNVFEFIITFAILQGIGYGLMNPVIYTAFNQYFDKKREVVNSVAHTALPAFAMLVPIGMQYCMDTFGYRATVAIIFAISLNSILAMLTLHPVEWHSIKIPLKVSDDKKNDFILNTDEKTTKENESSSCLNKLSNFLALDLVKNISFVNLIGGISSGLVCDFFFLLITPAILLNRGIDPAESAVILTIFQIGDTCSRACLILFNYFFKVRNRYVLFIGLTIISILQFATILSDNVLYIKTIVLFRGVARSWFFVSLPMALAEQNKERFAAAFGWYMISSGVLSLVLGIVIGIISKCIDNDIPIICLLSAVPFISMIFWLIEFILVKQK